MDQLPLTPRLRAGTSSRKKRSQKIIPSFLTLIKLWISFRVYHLNFEEKPKFIDRFQKSSAHLDVKIIHVSVHRPNFGVYICCHFDCIVIVINVATVQGPRTFTRSRKKLELYRTPGAPCFSSSFRYFHSLVYVQWTRLCSPLPPCLATMRKGKNNDDEDEPLRRTKRRRHCRGLWSVAASGDPTDRSCYSACDDVLFDLLAS